MATIKSYDNYTDTGRHIWVPGVLREAFVAAGANAPKQIRIYLSSTTKKAAIETMLAAGFLNLTSNNLRVGMGNTLTSLQESGVLDDGAVYVLDQNNFGSGELGQDVIRLDASGATLAGHLKNDVFIPA